MMTPEKRLARILADKRSGSSAIAAQTCRLLHHLLDSSKGTTGTAVIFRVLDSVTAAFPAMAILQTLRNRIVRCVGRRPGRLSRRTTERVLHALAVFTADITRMRTLTARHFAGHIGSRNCFLTLSSSGMVLAAAQALVGESAPSRRAKTPAFIVCESCPAREGVVMARRLAAAGCEVTVIPDAAIGRWITAVDGVVLGADWIDRRGFVNKTGSLALSLLALSCDRPVYVLGDRLRASRRVIRSRDLPRVWVPSSREEKSPNPRFDQGDFERVPWDTCHILCSDSGVQVQL